MVHVARRGPLAIAPFLGGTILCASASWKHKALMAGQRTSRGHRRWSRLAEQCTQAQCPRPLRAALRPFLRPASVICDAWCVCVGILVTVASAGGAGGAPCWTSARVLAFD